MLPKLYSLFQTLVLNSSRNALKSLKEKDWAGPTKDDRVCSDEGKYSPRAQEDRGQEWLCGIIDRLYLRQMWRSISVFSAIFSNTKSEQNFCKAVHRQAEPALSPPDVSQLSPLLLGRQNTFRLSPLHHWPRPRHSHTCDWSTSPSQTCQSV